MTQTLKIVPTLGLGFSGWDGLTQWVRHGVDLRTVQELLGHADIQTTMRYAHFAQSHAIRSIHDIEEIENRQLKESQCSENGTTGE